MELLGNNIIITKESVTSTNDILLDDEFEEWTSIIALHQTKGRGKIGRNWKSSIGNLQFSILVNIDSIPNINTLPFSVALAIGRALKMKVEYKWPNDIIISGKKLAGILIERKNDKVVIGIGINITEAPLPSSTCIIHHTNIVDKTLLANDIVNNIKRYQIKSQFQEILTEYKQSMISYLNPINVKYGNSVITGTFHDIDSNGNLLLINSHGNIERIITGEIF